MNDGNERRGICPRRFELVRLAAGDVEEKEAEALRVHVTSCSRCNAAVNSIAMRDAEFLQRHPFEEVAPMVLRGAGQRTARRRLVLRLAPAALVLLFLGGLWLALPPGSGVRTKGEIAIAFYVLEDGKAVQGRSGGVYHQGDRIQFSYSSGPNRYVFLVSLDGRGVVSNFNHRAAETSVPIEPGSGRVLEGSIILDESRGPERIFAVFSDKPLHFNDIKPAAEHGFMQLKKAGRSVRELLSLPLPHPQASILLEKE